MIGLREMIVCGAVAMVAGWSDVAMAEQYGNFTYVDLGSHVAITAFPNTVGGVVTIPGHINGKPVTAIGPGAFAFSKMTGVVFPAGLTTIGEKAFRNCDRITGTLSLPEGLVDLAPAVFSYCYGVSAVSLPGSLTSLPANSFDFCAKIERFEVSPANPVFRSEDGVLFSRSENELVRYPAARTGSYTVPEGITRIATRAFFDCDHLTEVVVPDGVSGIGDFSFSYCDALSSVHLPASMTSIGAYCFVGNPQLESIRLPAQLVQLGEGAFSNCNSLASIELPGSVTDLGSGVFASCDSLKEITVASGNRACTSRGGVLYDATLSTLLWFPSRRTGRFVVPPGVVEIDESAFADCLLQEVSLPAGLEKIGFGAFLGSKDLRRIRFPKSLKSLGSSSFSRCFSLTAAEFLGDAPAFEGTPFSTPGPGFKIHHFSDRSGYTSPTWAGYPVVSMGEAVPEPPEFYLEDAGGYEWTAGSSVAPFPPVLPGASAAVTVEIHNTGETTLRDLAVAIEGSAGIHVSPIPAAELPPGGHLPLTITFSPNGSGMHSSILRLTGSGVESPVEVGISALGAVPAAAEIEVRQGSGSNLKDGKSKISFGTVARGKQGPARIFTIRNTGTAPLRDLSIVIRGKAKKHFLLSQPRRKSLAAGASTTFRIRFKPGATGTHRAELQIMSTDADESPFDLKLTGLGAK